MACMSWYVVHYLTYVFIYPNVNCCQYCSAFECKENLKKSGKNNLKSICMLT